MKKFLLAFFWIEPSSVSHLFRGFLSKVYFKCIQSMYTPDQEVVKIKGSGCGVREVLGPGVYNLGLVCPGSATACDLELVTCPSLTLASNVKWSPRALRWWLGSIWPQHPPSPFPEDETWGGERGDSGSLPQCESCTLCMQKGEGGLLHHLCSWTPSWAPTSSAAGLGLCIRSEDARCCLSCEACCCGLNCVSTTPSPYQTHMLKS